jgi:N-methylhydantoinase A/acetophenone carboxylase
LNPSYYYGGKLVLNAEKAANSIRERVAKPLGLSVEEAAAIIRKIVDENMSSAIMKEVHLRGYSPEEFILFAAGGAGPTHVEGFRADIPKAVIFPFSPVFCAWGSSTMDIMHVYEHSKKLTLMEPGTHKLTDDFDKFNSAVTLLMDNAKTDLAGEGLDPASATFVLELDMLYGGQFHVKRTLSPLLFVRKQDDVRAICDAFAKEFSEAFSPFVVNPDGGVFLDTFVLKAIVATQKVQLPKMPLEGNSPDAAGKGKRRVYWAYKKDFADTPIYSFEKLRPGNAVQGPAVVEGEYTTLVVPETLRFSIDQHGLGILE